MYHPTIFDNVKVAFENHMYDLDSLYRMIDITNRTDRMDFAIMGRDFTLQFTKPGKTGVTAEIGLRSSLKELAGEILEQSITGLGCTLSLKFMKLIQDPSLQCERIEQLIKEIWETEFELTQTLSFVYGESENGFLNTIDMEFHHKMNEENIEDISDFLEYTLATLEVLQDV